MQLQGKVPLSTPDEHTPVPVRRPEPSAGYIAWGLGLFLAGAVVMSLSFGTGFAFVGALAVLAGTVGLVIGVHHIAGNIDTLTSVTYNEGLHARAARRKPQL